MLELSSERVRIGFSALGAKIVSVLFDGVDVVVGPASDADSLASDPFTGAILGRMAGRISEARFPLKGQLIELVANMGRDQLHGGPDNFSTVRWQVAQHDDKVICFTHHSPEGDQGYPGAVTVKACYRLDHHILSLELTATSDALTVLNLTNHAYWNMAGQGSGLKQQAEINAAYYLPLDEAKRPTGEIASVIGTRFDFRSPRLVAEAYDACFCLAGERGQLTYGLTLRDPDSGRYMEVFTTEPAIQFYTADHFGPAMLGKSGPLEPHGAIAIEPQNYPDAPNHTNFPSSQLDINERYYNRIEWRFFQSEDPQV